MEADALGAQGGEKNKEEKVAEDDDDVLRDFFPFILSDAQRRSSLLIRSLRRLDINKSSISDHLTFMTLNYIYFPPT